MAFELPLVNQIRELTVRRKEGPLLTSLTTNDASSRLVEAYRLHPNAIEALARCGQDYSAISAEDPRRASPRWGQAV